MRANIFTESAQLHDVGDEGRHLLCVAKGKELEVVASVEYSGTCL